MIDIDRFKDVNDTYGHDAGDQILRSVGEKLQQNIRDIDLLARLGGEEFGILLPNTEAGDAVKMAARLREASAETPYKVQGQPIIVTLSIGAATFNREMTGFDNLLKAADTAMYQAKSLGRNRVVYLG